MSHNDDDAYEDDDHHHHHDSRFKKTRPSSILTEAILEEISNSVQSFKPSKSLADLLESSQHNGINDSRYDDQEPSLEIDVVISGGGLKHFFMVGAAYVLQKHLRKHNVRIARISGTSAGSWAALCMLTNFDAYHWMEAYHRNYANPKSPILETYEHPDFMSLFDPNAYKICSGRLFISITRWTKWGPKLWIVSEFASNADLFAACLASSAIPYLTQAYAFRQFRGETVFDGGVFNNCPVFPDGVRRQLVFRLLDVEYPSRLVLNPLDSCIDALVIRGALLMSRFLQGEPTDAIVWLEQYEKLPKKKNSFVRSFVIPLSLGTILLSNFTGFNVLFTTFLETIGVESGVATTIVTFNEGVAITALSPFKYIGGALFGIVTGALQSMNLLI